MKLNTKKNATKDMSRRREAERDAAEHCSAEGNKPPMVPILRAESRDIVNRAPHDKQRNVGGSTPVAPRVPRMQRGHVRSPFASAGY